MSDSTPRSKVVALLLCFFLGGLGIHRFYLGYTIIGIAQLVTCGGVGIWVIIDFILLALDKLPDSSGNNLQQ